ncbi:hypothetical protein TNCV_88651 [Trichonephila clavipes]|nr:hypothetical protein TNCV_88651 [Trichonephila clavipes]
MAPNTGIRYPGIAIPTFNLRTATDLSAHTHTINGAKYSTFQGIAGLPKSEDFINEVADDAVSGMNLTVEERQERILQKREQINGTE